MNWEKEAQGEFQWSGEISNYEQKRALAQRVAALAQHGEVIGFGSGSTAYLTVLELGRRRQAEGLDICAIPTSNEIRMACYHMGIPVESLLHVRPDWAFDGADEVDGARNLIKGRGGAMYIEKLLLRASPRSYILADRSKLVGRLGEKFAVPVEVSREALVYVRGALLTLGAREMTLRPAKAKDGPVVTENGNYILDVRFQEIHARLEGEIKGITGVIDSGLFWGYGVELIVPEE